MRELAELIRDVWNFLSDTERTYILELLEAPQRDDEAIIAALAGWADDSHN